MRQGTLLALLGLIVLFAAFGLRVFGWLLAFILGTIVLALVAVATGLWVIKRRMRRRLEELGIAVEHQMRNQTPAARGDVIDVEGHVRKPRDGADEPQDP
ncbi:MAG: hypothetical protein WC876_02535 [Candidatus Thermoplasmatota archaeon]|jgi:uncharacterized protein (DUF58 family)